MKTADMLCTHATTSKFGKNIFFESILLNFPFADLQIFEFHWKTGVEVQQRLSIQC